MSYSALYSWPIWELVTVLMVYGTLPFNGEPVASREKRCLSAFIDYGIPALLYPITRKTSYDDLFSITGLFMFAVVNSIIVQGFTGYSLGRFITNSTLLRPFGRTGFIKPGLWIIPRFIPHLLVYLLAFPASNSCYGATGPCTEARWLWWPILIAGIASLVAFERSPILQTPWDVMAKTVVLNRRAA